MKIRFFILLSFLLASCVYQKSLKTGKNVVIIGSYRKFYDKILHKIDVFEKINITTLAPNRSIIVDNNADFVRFESDKNKDNKSIEEDFLSAIKKADFIYIFNPKGYIGLSSAFEMGFAHSIKKPIHCLEKPIDTMLSLMCDKIEKI